MIAPEMKIQPRRGFVQFPQPRRYTSVDDLLGLPRINQTPIGTNPDTGTLREHLAAAVAAAAASTVADMFGALGFGAQKTHMLNTTITALLAVKGETLGNIFDQVHQQPACRLAVDPLTQPARYMPEGVPRIKKSIMDAS